MNSIRSALAALLVLGSVALAGPASARTVTIEDSGGSGDTYLTVYDPQTGEWSFDEAGSLPNVDVLRTKVTYTRTAVRVKTFYTDLRKARAGSGIQVDHWLLLSDGGGVDVRSAGGGGDETWNSIYTDATAEPGGTIRRGHCPKISSTFDLRKDVVTVVIPTSCLAGDSSSIKYHGVASTWQDDPEAPDGSAWVWIDDVHDPSYETDTVARDCFWTCTGWVKVRRG